MKKETIEKLKELKESLNKMDYETIYCDLSNILIDYDNETQDNLYLYDRMRELKEFVTSDELIDLDILTHEAKYGVERLRYFINNTHDSNLYLINGYGNLENVTNDDFIEVIDEILEMLESEEK